MPFRLICSTTDKHVKYCFSLRALSPIEHWNTVGARIPNSEYRTPSQYWIFKCSVLGCSVFVWSKANFDEAGYWYCTNYSPKFGPKHSKTKQTKWLPFLTNKLVSLDRFIKNNYIKWSRLANSLVFQWSGPLENHPCHWKSECDQYSSPQFIFQPSGLVLATRLMGLGNGNRVLFYNFYWLKFAF